MNTFTAQVIVAFAFGIIFVVTLMVLAVKFPHPTPFQYNVFRIVLSLAVAGAAAMLPGFINIELNPMVGLLIRAGGTLAVFVIIYFFNPAQMAIRLSPDPSSQAANPLLQIVWKHLDPDLQDAFALAATMALRERKDCISTSALFSALQRLNPSRLSDFLARLPTDALPKSIPDDVEVDPKAIQKIRFLSPCVESSLKNLSPQATSENRLTSKDIFIDIARHGTGESVRRLRTHGVDGEKVNEIVRQLGWTIIERAQAHSV